MYYRKLTSALPWTTKSLTRCSLGIWPFEAEGDDPDDREVPGRLLGADVPLEALHVDEPDNPVPVFEVRSRFDGCVKAAGGGRMRAVNHPPGEKGCYVLAAIAAPA